MEVFVDIFHKIIIISIAVLCLSNGSILLLHSQYNKASKTLSYIILLWGFLYLYRSIDFYIDIYPESYGLFRANVLIVGIIYTFMMVLFPMQALLPGWLNKKRLFLLFLPIFVVSLIYMLGMRLLGEEPEEILTYEQLWDSIGHFNVWSRFVILFCNFIYIYGFLRWLRRFKKNYTKWRNENYSDRDDFDISWIGPYNVIMAMIFVCYLAVEFFGGKVPVILHSFVVLASFAYMFYKGFFYKTPYPESMVTGDPQNQNAERATEDETLELPVDEIKPVSETSFESKIPGYVEIFKNWMETEKPYLYKDFKLTDVSRVLPLNRSYLSRIFNEGFGSNFSEVVRRYRVEYARNLILRNPDLPSYKVADLSGFSSDTTFTKAFKQTFGMTPTKYKTKGEAAGTD